jgi:hypothetical protein
MLPVADGAVLEIEELSTAPGNGMRVLDQVALLEMKLTSFRLKDQVQILDLIGVGLVGGSFVEKVPEVLRRCLRQMVDSPEIGQVPEGADDPE